MSVIEAFNASGGSGVFNQSTAGSTLSDVLVDNTGLESADVTAGDGSEIIFNLCDHFNKVVGSGDSAKVSSSQTQTLSNNVLKRTYTFSFDLDFVANNLDVQDE